MKALKASLLVFLIVFGVSCEDPEPAPPHPIVGDWTLDVVQIRNTPSDYSGYNGFTLTDNDWFDGITGYQAFTYQFNVDNTYEERYAVSGPDFVTTGDWRIDNETELVLESSDGSNDLLYDIIGQIEETELTLSEPITLSLLSDADWEDLLTNYPIDDETNPNYEANVAKWDEYFDTRTVEVQVDLWYVFAKQQ